MLRSDYLLYSHRRLGRILSVCVVCPLPFPVVGLEFFGAFTIRFLGSLQRWREAPLLTYEKIRYERIQ